MPPEVFKEQIRHTERGKYDQLIQWFAQNPQLQEYLQTHGIFPHYDYSNDPSAHIIFLDQNSFWNGEIKYVPVQMSFRKSPYRKACLTNVIGIRIYDGLIGEHGEKAFVRESWAKENNLSVVGGEGELWHIHPDAYLKLEFNPDTEEAINAPVLLEKPKKKDSIEKGPKRKTKLTPEKLKIDRGQIVKHANLEGTPYETVAAASIKALLTRMVNDGIPNNPTSLRHYMGQAQLTIAECAFESSEWEPEPGSYRFSPTELGKFTDELTESFKEFDLRVSKPRVSFSDITKYFRSIYGLYAKIRLGQKVPETTEPLGKSHNFYTSRGSDLHFLDAVFDGLRSRNSDDIFPTSVNLAHNYRELKQDVNFPIFKSESDVKSCYTQIAEKFIGNRRECVPAIGEINYWNESLEGKRLEDNVEKLVQSWTCKAVDEWQEDAFVQREINMILAVDESPEHMRPFGLNIWITFDAENLYPLEIEKGRARGIEMRDLKLTNLETRNKRTPASLIDEEALLFEGQLLELLQTCFTASFYDPGSCEIRSPKKDNLYFAYLNENKLPNVNTKSFRHWFDPDTGKEELEQLIASQQYATAHLIRKVIAPYVHMTDAFGKDLHALEQHVLRTFN